MLELWHIVLISAVGGVLLIVFTIIVCCVCCRRRKRKQNSLKAAKARKSQNGNAWQAHDHVVEVSDDEDSPKLDGLCKDTISGSTFPRIKKEQNADHHKEDGLCEETKLRSLQRRGKLEGAFLKPEVRPRSTSESGLSTVLPLGTLATTVNSSEKIDNTNSHQSTEVVQIEHGFRKELLPNGTVPNDSKHTQRKDSEDSSSSSEQSDQERKSKESNSINNLKTPLYRKRSKSFGQEVEVPPEYTKPVKRAVSNPSITTRDSMFKKDKRFESLDAWKYSMPIPEPDYPLERNPDVPSASNVPEKPEVSSIPRTPSFLARELRTNTDYDGQTVHYTTQTRSFTDGDVTIVTEYDRNETTNIPLPPPLPQGTFELQEKESSQNTHGPSYTEQRIEINSIPAPPALPHGAFTTTVQENTNKWITSDPSYTQLTNETNHNPTPPPLPQGAYTSLPQENESTWKTSSSFAKVDSSYQPATSQTNHYPTPPPLPQGAYTSLPQENESNWKTSSSFAKVDSSYQPTTSQTNHNPAPPPLPQGAYSTTFQEKESNWKTSSSFAKMDSSYQPTTKVLTEKKQTSSWTSHEQPAIDFRQIKLNPTSTRIKYGQEQTITSQDQIPQNTNDASRIMPSTLMSERHEYKTASTGASGHAQHNTTQPSITTNTKTSHYSAGPSYISTQTEYTKKTFELPGNGALTGNTSVTTKTQTSKYKTTERHQPTADSHSQVDFRGFKLRSTPDSIKEHIGFRKDLHPVQHEKTPEVTTMNEVQSNGDVRIPASNSPAQKKFGFNSHQSNSQIPQTKYGSPSQTTHSQQSQKTYGFQHTTTQDTGLKVFTMPGQSANVTRSESARKQTVSMNGTVKKHSDTTSPGLVIERLSDDKPVPGKAAPAGIDQVVMRPKKADNTPVDTRGETEEERRKNWKREQMEQRLSTTLVMNERQPIMQASGLALKSVLPELFTKIKQIGDHNEEDTTTVAAAT